VGEEGEGGDGAVNGATGFLMAGERTTEERCAAAAPAAP